MVGRRELKWVAMIAAMETDWRTRCVGEAMDQGYTFLRLTCSCGRITDFPFPVLLRHRDVSRDTFIGNIGFRSSATSVFVARSGEARRRSSGSIRRGMPLGIDETPRAGVWDRAARVRLGV